MLLEAFDSNWIAPLGPDVDAFEAEFAERIGIGPRGGPVERHRRPPPGSLLLLGVGPGDEVLVPSFTFVATANAVCLPGCRLRSSWTARRRRGPSIPTSWPRSFPTAGPTGSAAPRPGDRRPLRPIGGLRRPAVRGDSYGVPLIEDAAEALGATYRGRPAGSFGVAAAFSFNGNKIITTSGGGMLVTQSAEVADRARFLATQARDPFPHYEHSTVGFNYRLSNLLAALGRAQLMGLDSRIDRRRRITAGYRQLLADSPGIDFMPQATYGEPNHWLTCITVDPERFGVDRETIRLALEGHDIESRPTWKPLHLQPVFATQRMIGGPVCESVFDAGLCLPSGSSLSDAELRRIADIILSLHR
jgi:dTDP-4-amino-4,6-dideoxygalactose transaminase